MINIMNNENSIVWPTLIISLLFLFASIGTVIWILRVTVNTNELVARTRWFWIVSLGGGPLVLLVVSFFLFGNDVEKESIYTKVNNISCFLSGGLPIFMAVSLFQFSRWAPWFWRNRDVFPHNDHRRNGN
jgi:hypothetical protein